MTEQILSQMTLEDKIALCSGADFWQTKAFEKYNIPSLFMCDGPHGLRKQDKGSDMIGINESGKATCFPAEVTTASSWDVSVIEKIGRAVGEEARNQKVGLVLGPGANIKRNPLCGRNFEYFSEDPYLTGKLAGAFIKGVQSTGVGACLKHFACNSQEKDRLVSDGIVDERTLREIYLAGFEAAVKEAKPATVMCSYPKVNGVHASDSRKLLTDILRDEWGFDGTVVTDWSAMNDRMEGFKAGCDLNMPGGSAYMEKDAAGAVEDGRLSQSDIDRCARRILNLVMNGTQAMTGDSCDYDAHHTLSRDAAAAGAVLLKNEDNLLPLKKDEDVLVVGSMAKEMRFQGSGSSHINASRLSQPLSCFEGCEYAPGCDEKGNTTPELIDEIKSKARKAGAVIVFAGLPGSWESEGFDRQNMKMPRGHADMINAACDANSNVAVVLMCGSAVECPWSDRVKSILYMGLPGQAGGEAAKMLIYGKAVPSGKLAESWPYKYEDVPSSEIFGKTRDALYEEGIYVGYRYYDKAGVPVKYPFGYGMSYTDFEYSNLIVDGGTARVTVRNTGSYDGAEVVQMYVCMPQDGIHRPVRELKGFEKVFLKKGESREVSFPLDERGFCIYENGWVTPEGTYRICIGNLSNEIQKTGVHPEIPVYQKNSFYESCSGKPVQSEWENMLGRKYTPPAKAKKGSYTMENTINEMKSDSLVMKIL